MRLPKETIVWKYGRGIIRTYFKMKFDITRSGQIPPPPFILVANHVSFWDPFFLGSIIDVPMAWVTARGVFENVFLGPLIRATGAIPKRKARADTETIRGIYSALRQGAPVGLFPEGNITWSGETGYFFPGTDKLLDRAGVPVLAAKICGAWLLEPRWAEKTRKGPIHIQFKTFYDSSALEFINHSEWEWQKEKKIPYPGKEKARGLERIIWFCPFCEVRRDFSINQNKARCRNCGNILEVDDYGFINGKNGIEIIAEQKKLLENYLKGFSKIEVSNVNGDLRKKEGTEKKKKVRGRLSLDRERLEVGDKVFSLNEIRGETTFMKRILEFSTEKYYVRLKIPCDSFFLCSSLENLKEGYNYGLERN